MALIFVELINFVIVIMEWMDEAFQVYNTYDYFNFGIK
jgi:hypothetical protein